jgi:hypothetical protein
MSIMGDMSSVQLSSPELAELRSLEEAMVAKWV